ncbi:MAG: chromate transporter [Fischerella sp.]|jgi:chromate transporter|uniref:chromate transporter n=1 Tax=Fischerella sp. TaxID=1191 RepID=UPI0017FAC254|nr:chromate transporter [Fischerella sp.]NWF57863.1 chromate transporter [Fischerella sp.]
MHVLLDLFFTFAYLALISVGNSRAVITEMERLVVTVHGWMSHQAFVEAYALGLLVPGPNMLNVVLIGNHVAGLAGAVASGLGMFGPTSCLLAGVAWFIKQPNPPAWIKQFHAALGPVTIGLMLATAWNLGKDIFLKDIFGTAVCFLALLLSVLGLLNTGWVIVLALLAGAIKGFFSN